ncbi:MAG: hypothetical protein V1772_02570 [Chloroflexota bacterium]
MRPVVQSGPNTTWLDEELRREKALVQELRETIGKQQVTLVDQHQRILTLESALTKLEGQLARIPDLQEALEHTRDDLILRVTDLRQERQKAEGDFIRNRQTEREQDNRAIQQMMVDLQRIAPVEQDLAVRQAEERRLNEALLRTQASLDEIRRQLARGEDGQRQLADAVEKTGVAVGQVEAAAEGDRKRLQAALARIASVEVAVPKLEQQTAALQDMRQEMTKEHDEFLEVQRRADQSRAQTVTEWGRRLEGFAHQLDLWADQMRFFGDQHEKNRKLLREIQELAQEVSQQQERLRQTQRLAEEQTRRELVELRSEGEQRWAKEVQRRETVVEAQGVRDAGQDRRLGALEAEVARLLKTLDDAAARIEVVRSEQSVAAEQLSRSQQRAWTSLAATLQTVAVELRESAAKEDK